MNIITHPDLAIAKMTAYSLENKTSTMVITATLEQRMLSTGDVKVTSIDKDIEPLEIKNIAVPNFCVSKVKTICNISPKTYRVNIT